MAKYAVLDIGSNSVRMLLHLDGRETQQLETPPPGRRSVPASVPWVPSVAGLLMAGTVVQDLLNGGGLIP